MTVWHTLISSDKPVAPELVEAIDHSMPGHLKNVCTIERPDPTTIRITGKLYLAGKGPMATHHIMERLSRQGHHLRVLKSDLMEVRVQSTISHRRL
jgi:hypothetical protein